LKEEKGRGHNNMVKTPIEFGAEKPDSRVLLDNLHKSIKNWTEDFALNLIA
jgi:hypothetical protein